MIFARENNDNLTSLVKKIDAATKENAKKNLKSFVCFLSDDEKLSQPSFTPMRSGARIGDLDVACGAPLAVELGYEQVTIPAAA